MANSSNGVQNGRSRGKALADVVEAEPNAPVMRPPASFSGNLDFRLSKHRTEETYVGRWCWELVSVGIRSEPSFSNKQVDQHAFFDATMGD